MVAADARTAEPSWRRAWPPPDPWPLTRLSRPRNGPIPSGRATPISYSTELIEKLGAAQPAGLGPDPQPQ